MTINKKIEKLKYNLVKFLEKEYDEIRLNNKRSFLSTTDAYYFLMRTHEAIDLEELELIQKTIDALEGKQTMSPKEFASLIGFKRS